MTEIGKKILGKMSGLINVLDSGVVEECSSYVMKEIDSVFYPFSTSLDSFVMLAFLIRSAARDLGWMEQEDEE